MKQFVVKRCVAGGVHAAEPAFMVEGLRFSGFRKSFMFTDSTRENVKSMLRKPFLCGINGFVLEKSELLRLRFKAVRCGAWFRALSRVDRAVVDLTLRVVDVVWSRRLAAAVLSVVRKLEEAVEGRVSRLLKEVGFQLALKLSLLAQKWGNVHAQHWASDASFAKFLVIMHINNSKMFTP